MRMTSVIIWLCLVMVALSLAGCAVTKVACFAVKTTAKAGKMAVNGSLKGARAMGRVATGGVHGG